MYVDENKVPFRFVYKNAKGEITRRCLLKITRQSTDYISGIQEIDYAYRTFRKEQIQKVLASRQEWLDCGADDPIPEQLQKDRPKDPKRAAYFNHDHKPEICFTGFSAADRAKLEEMSVEAGLFVRKSVTKNLSFLCTGYNAGPKKIAAALAMGIVIMDEQAFHWLLETGEIPV